MLINCIIIDDEPLARKGLREYIADIDFLRLTGDFDGPLQATDSLAVADVQLIFIDIQMPRISGLEFIKTLRHAPPVIFTTAYPDYAVEGFEMNALDYLVKPISFERFFKAALKAKEYYELRESNITEGAVEAGYFFIKADNKLVKIALDDILFIEGQQNYISIQTHEKKFITYLTFKAAEDFLPKDNFIKVHKSFLVAAKKIDHIEGNEFHILHHRIPVSRNLKEEVMEKLLKGRFLKR